MWENAQLRSFLDRIGAIECTFSCDRWETGSSEALSVELAATLDAGLEDTPSTRVVLRQPGPQWIPEGPLP
jgi:hypothetical protein